MQPLPASSSQKLPFDVALDVVWSGRLDILLCVYRIGQAIQAFPQDATDLDALRWNEGIARELVSWTQILMGYRTH